MCRLLLVSFFVFLNGSCLAVNDSTIGRYLPDGSFQPRNLHATNQNKSIYSYHQNPLIALTTWGEDIRVSYFPIPSSYDPELATFGNHVYIIWWYAPNDSLFFAKSDNDGRDWTYRRLTDDSTRFAVRPQITACDSFVFVTYRAARPWYGIYLQRSTDYGTTWQPTQRLYYTLGENYSEHPAVVSLDSMVYISTEVRVNYVPPNQNWDMWLFRSKDYGATWPDTFVISDSTSSGLGPDMVTNRSGIHIIRGLGLPSSSVMEVLYSGSSDQGVTWFGPTMLSDNDTSGSFWPQIACWGDSNVIVSWTDYKNSPEEWTGDAFVSRSTDGGHTWSTPLQLTSSHGIQGTDLFAVGDTVLVCYDDNRDGTSAVYATASFDGGLTWQDDLRVSDSPYYSFESSMSISNGRGHISWADSRNNPDRTVYEIYYDSGFLSTAIHNQDEIHNPIETYLGCCPNPFNSATTFTITGAEQAEIAIYDITGRVIAALKTENGRTVWDAARFPSGLYFAVLQKNNQALKLTLIK